MKVIIKAIVFSIFFSCLLSLFYVQEASASVCHNPPSPVKKNMKTSEPNREPPLLGTEYFHGTDVYYDDSVYINGKPFHLKFKNKMAALLIPDRETNFTFKIVMPRGDKNEFSHIDMTFGNVTESWERGVKSIKDPYRYFEWNGVQIMKKQDSDYIYMTFLIKPTPNLSHGLVLIRMWDTYGASNQFSITEHR